MKKLLTTLLVLSFVSTSAMAWPFGKKQPKPTPTPAAVAKPTPRPTISGGREIVKEIGTELKSAKEQNAKLKVSLDKALEQVKTAEAQTAVVQKQADDLKEWGVIQQAEAQKFMQKYNDAVKRYHRLKMIAALIAAAVGVLLGLQIMGFVPPPYSLLVPVGGAGLFATLVWFFL